MDVPNDYWFLKKVLRFVVKKHSDDIRMGRFIKKPMLYQEMMWWFHCTREESRDAFRRMAALFPGVRFQNAGLKISITYLDKGESGPPASPRRSADGGFSLCRRAA